MGASPRSRLSLDAWLSSWESSSPCPSASLLMWSRGYGFSFRQAGFPKVWSPEPNIMAHISISSFSGPENGLQQCSGPTHVTRNPTPAPQWSSLLLPGPPRRACAPGLPPPPLPALAARGCLGLQPCAPLVCKPTWPCSPSTAVAQACVCPVS